MPMHAEAQSVHCENYHGFLNPACPWQRFRSEIGRFRWHAEARRRGVATYHREARSRSILPMESGLADALEEEMKRVF